MIGIETIRWAVGWVPPFTLSGNTMVTLSPFFTLEEMGGIPIGFWIDFLVSASIASKGICGGSGYVSPGMNTSVVPSGSSAFMKPCPYSKFTFTIRPLWLALVYAVLCVA